MRTGSETTWPRTVVTVEVSREQPVTDGVERHDRRVEEEAADAGRLAVEDRAALQGVHPDAVGKRLVLAELAGRDHV